MKLKRFFTLFANSVAIVLIFFSVLWTGLTVVMLSNHYLAESNPIQSPKHQVSISNSGLPRFDIQMLAKPLGFFLLPESNKFGEDDELPSRFGDTVVAMAVILNMQDSTFFIASKTIGECGCPAAQANRYEIKYRYLHPVTFEILEEKTINGLSAEAVDDTLKDFSF